MPGVNQTFNSEMTALVTGDPSKSEELAKKYNLKTYSYDDYDKLLDDDIIDAVYIATPNFMHRQFAEPALLKGYHVLLEKPMDINEENCRAIIEAAKTSGAKLMIAYRLHCEKGTLELLERIRKGDIGDPRIFHSVFTQPLKEENHRAQNGYWAGPVPDMGTYPINACRNIFRCEPIEVCALGFKTPGRESLQLDYDAVTVTLRFPQDRIACFTVSYSASGSEFYHIVGTKGDIMVSPCYMFGQGFKLKYKGKFEGKEEEKEFSETDQFAGETEYFSSCILEDRQVEPNGEEGWLDVRILEAVERSLQSCGKPQNLPPYARHCPPACLPTKEQVQELSLPPSEPKLVNASPPSVSD